ncbi:ferric reductase NAD binding domain-containing protein [Phlyctochytrium arcticum]|nr:ferric reductase NAD binding domain-containing protein [Phlyctochytrium arcticum]
MSHSGALQVEMLVFDKDNNGAGKWYFGSLVLLVAAQSIPRMLRRIAHLVTKDKHKTGQPLTPPKHTPHNPLKVLAHRISYLQLPFYPYLTTRLIFFLLAYITLSAVFAAGSINLQYDVGYPRFGYLALANICAAIIFGLRNTPAYYLLALPFERTVQFHKWFGAGALVFGWVHGGLYLRQWTEFDQTEFMFEMRPRLQFGPAIAASLSFMFLTALAPVRQRFWEFFWILHIFGFVAVIILVNLHTEQALPFTLPVIILWFIDRLIRFARGWFRPAIAHASVDDSGQCTRLTIRQKPLWGRHFTAGQYVFLNVPKAGLVEWHPASIVSSAAVVDGVDGKPTEQEYVLVLRNVGKFTHRLTESAVIGTPTPITVRVDGPYGKWDMHPQHYPLLVLVAGGIGATPIISVLLTTLHERAANSSTLPPPQFHWAIQTEAHLAWFAAELAEAASLGAHIYVYVTQSAAAAPPPPALHASMSTDMIKDSSTAHILSATQQQPSIIQLDDANGDRIRTSAGYEVIYQRPNITTICKDIKNKYPDMDAALGICGPQGMIHDARRAARLCSDRQSLWHMHAETFDL